MAVFGMDTLALMADFPFRGGNTGFPSCSATNLATSAIGLSCGVKAGEAFAVWSGTPLPKIATNLCSYSSAFYRHPLHEMKSNLEAIADESRQVPPLHA